MKKIITLATLGLLAAAVPMSAQTVYDAAKITNKDLNGTARFVGMGGAMGALGGDISTIGTNPAGIGIYRSNDAMVSFGLSAYGTESNYMGYKMNSDKTRASFDNVGFVLSSKIGNATALRYVNFGFNYHKAKSFYKNMSMSGNLGDYTQTDYMAAQAGGIKDWSGDIYTDPEVGWLSALGYDSYLITDLIAHDGQGSVPSGYVPYIVNGTQVKNLDGNLVYRTPEEYGGMFWGGNGNFRSEERGGIDQYDFNISFNINDRVYLGMTIGAYAIDYSKYTFYDEDYGNGQGYNLQSWNKIHGSGFDVKFGAIVRPFEYSPLRIGLAIHTPTYYNLDYKTNARLESDVLNDLDITNESGIGSGVIGQYNVDTYDIMKGDMVRQFRLQTPWTYNVSLGYTIGTALALGAEYEYQDYSSMKFKDQEGYSETFEYENSTTPMMKGVSTIRLGAEYKVIPQFALRAGYNYTSAIFNNDAYKDLPYNSIQTDTDFANTKALSNYTLGIGYRGSMFYADLAYKFSSYKEDFHPFINAYMDGDQLVIGSPEATKVKNTRSQVLLTLGLRF
ncbi:MULTISPECIES: outer membrane protein transport protein [Bacteroides]|uniref:outer membrane protein transport protein n=1 Tax=Bacteroides TaxID=816 RepID=UPI000EED6807|nr:MULTISPECIES: outer membrane protein transport protein [Bacteroides]MBS7575740.1 outer membrane protein transport protein [Bacteroides propionicigenes]HBO05562.1 hemin receptor [Bacteroides sp.]